jgi:TonB family protein
VARAAPPASAAAASKDPALARFTREVQRAGTRVLDKRRYPALASMGKKWTGKTQIEVQFAPGGYISRIVLAESCGHAPFDEKALELARSIMFPRVPKELSAREFSVRFPIEFRSGKG